MKRGDQVTEFELPDQTGTIRSLTSLLADGPIVLFFYLVPEGTPKATYWIVTGGGTAISMLIGWWLAVRGGKEAS